MEIQLINIDKHFGMVHANNSISLKIPAGTIQGILGENGAGKSTLMKILSGFFSTDSGQIILDGKPAALKSPSDALLFGVGMLHQDPLDFPTMTVLDNILIGTKGGILLDRQSPRKSFLDIQKQFGFSIDPDSYLDTLTVGERQQLEITRLIYLGARVLILDEPTTGISAGQKEKLFATLRLLASQGMTVLFVSHKLEDVEDLCHKIAVLRKGQLVGEISPPFSTDDLVELMFGRKIGQAERETFSAGSKVLELQGVGIEDQRINLQNIHLEINHGEIIGFAGMEGSGQSLLLRACAGFVRPTAGKILVNENDLTGKSYQDYLNQKIAFMPASRMEEGLIPGLTIGEHVALLENTKELFINWKEVREITHRKIEDFSIIGKPDSYVEKLSGGNQQRALLALMRPSLNLLLLEHPTRGLDIESTIYIWEKLKTRCARGTAIIFLSSDLDEILKYSDKIMVFFSGKVSPPLLPAKTNVDRLGQLIGGKNWDEFCDMEIAT